MSDLEKFQEILNNKETRLNKVMIQLNKIGTGTLNDPKLVKKRIKLRRESTDLQWMIRDLKEIIQAESL